MSTQETAVAVQEEKKQEALQVQGNQFSQDWKMAQVFARSNLVPKDFKGRVEDVFVAITMGREVGLRPMQSVQNIAVINGRPTMWGDAVLALVKASSKLEWISEVEATQESMAATCTVKRVGEPNEVKRSFSKADAERAGLWGKQGPWTNYPRRMLQLRARAFALRDAFPDVLRGLAIREEVEDYAVNVEAAPAENLMPRRASEVPAHEVETPPEEPAFTDPPPAEEPTTTAHAFTATEKQIARLYAKAHANEITNEVVKLYLQETFQIDDPKQFKSREDYEKAVAWAEAAS